MKKNFSPIYIREKMDASAINYANPFVQNFGGLQASLQKQQMTDQIREGIELPATMFAANKLLPYAQNAAKPIMESVNTSISKLSDAAIQKFTGTNKMQPVDEEFGANTDEISNVLGQSINKPISSSFIKTAPVTEEAAGEAVTDAAIGAASLGEAASLVLLPVAIGGMGYLLKGLLDPIHKSIATPNILASPQIRF